MLSVRPYAQSTAWKPFSLYFKILLTPLTSFWWNLLRLNRLFSYNSYETRLKRCLKKRDCILLVLYLYKFYCTDMCICWFKFGYYLRHFYPLLKIPCAVFKLSNLANNGGLKHLIHVNNGLGRFHERMYSSQGGLLL